MLKTLLTGIAVMATAALAAVAPPPRYAFGYAAGRFPGHIDRTHSEVADGAGGVRGSYSYLDPLQRVRTVEYAADAAGFRVLGAAAPPETAAVAAARRRHLAAFARIAAEHRQGALAVPAESVAVSRARDKHLGLYREIAEEHARLAKELDAERARNEGTEHPIY